MDIKKVSHNTPPRHPSSEGVSRKLLTNVDLTKLAAGDGIRGWAPSLSPRLRGKITQGKGNPSAVARSDSKGRSQVTNRSFTAMVSHTLNHKKGK